MQFYSHACLPVCMCVPSLSLLLLSESQLATAPTNGSVVLWDVNKRFKNKLDHVFENCHQRAVNKLSYHPREPHVLLSGSQDYTMRIFVSCTC